MKLRAGKWFLAGSAAVLGLASILTPSAASLAKGSAQVAFTCPMTSANSYVQGPVYQYDLDNPVRPAEENADKNIEYRGIYEGTSGPYHLKNYGPSTDHALPPQIATLFRPYRQPRFTTGYEVNDWIWNESPDPGYSYGPAPYFDVSMLGLHTRAGEALHAPQHSRTLGAPFGLAGAVVLYANEDSITLKFTREDSVARGYTMQITGICTDPNLLALYRSLDNADRNSTGPGSGNTPRDLIPDYDLPGLTHGQVFGVAASNEIQVAVRDEGLYIDPRSAHDWWRVR